MPQYAHANLSPERQHVRQVLADAVVAAQSGPGRKSHAPQFREAAQHAGFRGTYEGLIAELRDSGCSSELAKAAAWAAMFTCSACSRWVRPDLDRDWGNIQRRQDGGLDHIDCLFTTSVRKSAQRKLDRYQSRTSKLAALRGDRLA